MTVRYFSDTKPSKLELLRRTQNASGIHDEAFYNGQWEPTKVIIDYAAGHDDAVSEISEAQARKAAPRAFA